MELQTLITLTRVSMSLGFHIVLNTGHVLFTSKYSSLVGPPPLVKMHFFSSSLFTARGSRTFWTSVSSEQGEASAAFRDLDTSYIPHTGRLPPPTEPHSSCRKRASSFVHTLFCAWRHVMKRIVKGVWIYSSSSCYGEK